MSSDFHSLVPESFHKQVAQRATIAHRANFTFSYCRTMGDDDPRGLANLDPRGMIGRILIIATHKILKLLTSWFQRRRFFFLRFPIVSLREMMTPGRG